MLNGLKIYLRKGIFSDSGAGTFPLQLHISHSWEHTVQLFGESEEEKNKQKIVRNSSFQVPPETREQ